MIYQFPSEPLDRQGQVLLSRPFLPRGLSLLLCHLHAGYGRFHHAPAYLLLPILHALVY